MIRELYEGGVLTQEQYDAIVDESSEVLCLACAGSGKSRTLAFRIARLISEGALPENIVAFTFTEKAADSIKRRVAEALEKCGLSVQLVGGMFIGTIHAYCQNLLGEMDAKYRQYEVLDENRLKLFLLSRYFDLGLRELREARRSALFGTISEVSNAWKIANDELLDLSEIEREYPLLGLCLKNIDARLHRDQYIDFSLMIRLVVENLRADRAELNHALRNVKHLMVDEYQDVNPSQEALISGIYRRIETLFVVGDDDQSIYAWRGADVRNIIEFDTRYPSCSKHTLSTNFRSTEAIVSASNRFIQLELGPSRIDKTPSSHSDGNVRHFGNFWFNSRAEEADWVAGRIETLIGTKYSDGGEERGLTKSDFAILFRSVQGGDPPYHRDFTTALATKGLQYIIEAEGSVFERPHTQVIRDAMELLRDAGVPRSIVTTFFNDSVLPVFPNADLNEFISIITDWNNQIHRPIGGARRKVYPQKLVHELLAAFRVATTPFENEDQVMRDLGVFSSIILDVEKVFISIDTSGRYQTILNFLQKVAESGYNTTDVELMTRPDAVTISTVHKMKGLEFPVVFIVDAVRQRFPVANSSYRGWLPATLMRDAISRGLYQTDNSSEARLFYTAITRAERFLYITGGADHPGLVRPKQPSAYKIRLQNLQNPEILTDHASMPDRETAPEKMRIDEESMPTSFTEIKDYLECPMKYKFRKIYGFSPAVPELFGFGLTTHTAINKLHQLYEDSAPTRRQAEEVTQDVFHLKHVFKSDREDAHGPYENARDAAKRIVGQYAENFPADFTQTRTVEQKFEIKAGKALITGSIDLLLKEDPPGNILEAKVIDFKSMDYPDEVESDFFWINLSLQVQLYAYAASTVLGENAKTGAVHLLKERNIARNRVDIPISDRAINAAISNIEWGVDRILERDFPMRPSAVKCPACDFRQVCPKRRQEFRSQIVPPALSVPRDGAPSTILIRSFSDCDG